MLLLMLLLPILMLLLEDDSYWHRWSFASATLASWTPWGWEQSVPSTSANTRYPYIPTRSNNWQRCENGWVGYYLGFLQFRARRWNCSSLQDSLDQQVTKMIKQSPIIKPGCGWKYLKYSRLSRCRCLWSRRTLVNDSVQAAWSDFLFLATCFISLTI